MRNFIPDVVLVNGINWVCIAVLTLNDVKDVVAITLGVVSIISTLLIIRENLRRARSHHRNPEITEKKPSGLRFDVKNILW
jgi:hypothetical protein